MAPTEVTAATLPGGQAGSEAGVAAFNTNHIIL